MAKILSRFGLAVAALVVAAGAQAQGEHLLISEAGISLSVQTNEASSEYVEIYNPTLATIPLGNYYLSDNDLYRYISTSSTIPLIESDQIVKFPPGASLQSGQVAVVTGGASNFLAAFHGGSLLTYKNQIGSPLLFEVGETDPAVDNMISLKTTTSTLPLAFNYTNTAAGNGEYAVLFHWDGLTDLVQDVDIVQWGGQLTGGNAYRPKTANDKGKNNTPYLVDAGGPANLTIGNSGAVITRTTIEEMGEVFTGGNGLLGHDESTEDNSETWVGGAVATATPGRTNLTLAGQNLPPRITSSDRDLQYPNSSQQIVLTANVVDPENSINAVRFYVDFGTGFTPVTATSAGSNNFTASIGPYPDGTLVKYYVEAVDAGAVTVLQPLNAPASFKTFLVDNAPAMPGDVVINEIVYDNPGSDTYEYVELKNNRNTPVNISGLRFADANRSYFIVPEGTTIAPLGFLVFSLDPVKLAEVSAPEPGVLYLDWGTFNLNNTAIATVDETVLLVHPNAFDYNNTLVELDIVPFDVDGAWPEVGGLPFSLELKNGNLDNSLPGSWAQSIGTITPGRQNTVFQPARVVDVSRDPLYPAANAPVVVTATIEPASPATTVQSVTFHYGVGGSYTAVNMPMSATPNVYTATIAGQPAGTVMSYYITMTNSFGEVGTEPAGAPVRVYTYIVDTQPIAANSIVINEVLYDNVSGDFFEYIELYNRTDNPVDISYAVLRNRQNIPFVLPANTVVPANSYLLLTESSFNFRSQYGTPSVPLVEWADAFNLPNDEDRISLTHTHDYKGDGSGAPIAFVNFDTSAPWPTWPNAPTNTEELSPNRTGRSIELINPNLPDSGTNGAHWLWTTAIISAQEPILAGTPGAQNSVFSTSNIRDWTLY